MTWLRDYLMSMICASMICALLVRFVKSKGMAHALLKMLCGLFLTYTVIKPLPAFKTLDFSGGIPDYAAKAQQAADMGVDLSRNALRQSIKDQIESYILEKARQLELDVQVEVDILADEIPVPKAVSVYGKVSPYAKQKLSAVIEKDIGVSMENQKWN